MILYLILSLSLSLVVCIPFNNYDNEILSKTNIMSVRHVVAGKSFQLLTDFINRIRVLYENNIYDADQIFSDSSIAAIVSQMDEFTRLLAKSFVIQYSDEIIHKNSIIEESFLFKKRFIKETSASLLKKLVQILLNAYKKGSEYFYKVLNDPDVQGILDHLGPFSRKLADSIIGQFKELIDQVDEATKPKSKRQENVELQERKVKELIRLLTKASKLGPIYFNDLTDSNEFKQKKENLGVLGNAIIDSVIAQFVEIFDHFEKVTIKELETTFFMPGWIKNESNEIQKFQQSFVDKMENKIINEKKI